MVQQYVYDLLNLQKEDKSMNDFCLWSMPLNEKYSDIASAKFPGSFLGVKVETASGDKSPSSAKSEFGEYGFWDDTFDNVGMWSEEDINVPYNRLCLRQKQET